MNHPGRVVVATALLLVTSCSGRQGSAPLAPELPLVGPSSSPSTPQSAAVVKLSDALQVASTYTTAHLRIVYSGDRTGTTELDAGAGVGVEVTSTSTGSAQVRCTGKACFVLSDAAGLSSPRFGLAVSTARAHAGYWLRVTPPSPLYDRLVAGLTLSTVVDQIRLAGHIVVAGPTSLDGVNVDVIRGLDPSGVQAETLYVARDTGLPVGFLEVGQTETRTGSWSGWGEPVEVPVPQRFAPLPKAGTVTSP